MKIKDFKLNSDDQVVVKVVREVLNLFKIETGCPEGYDWDLLDIENNLQPGAVPVVETVIDMVATDGERVHISQTSTGRQDERFAAGKHRLIKLNLYQLLRKQFGFEAAPWGILHGVRPTKIVHRLLDSGLSREQVIERLLLDYEASEEKAVTIVDMAIRQQPFLAKTDQRTISIYVGIPFCLSRCLYCSFPANLLPKNEELDRFMTVFYKDLEAVREAVAEYGFKVQSIYVGGGTPTSLPDRYFREMLTAVRDAFFGEHTVEFTVEAGRPDSMTPDKIRTMVDMKVTRVSANPQTMQQRTLKRIGRNHTPEAIVTMFGDLRAAGIPEINMDLIIGLPGEGVADIEDTMKKIVALGPDDITLHSLALKRGSRLKMNLEDYELPDDSTCRAMFRKAMDYIDKAGMKPYYLYRQGYMSGQLENVGCCREGAESMYNIQIMEEHQTILGIGGAATSKIVNFREKRLKSAFNAKDLITYLRDIDIYIDKRASLLAEAYGEPV
ncbi:MAG: coproporphyrinogen dehydrogenase HemZ [Anaerovibrio sp.]|uniref:coproporphyrinogen dehydrogenase HemZ n=1 Tax=Anaerovibrio sp. TaxID=1872532 RepID=UPI0025E76C42|nr:coproporphyrinogen dehydrogenase HemZ [Anaerovibrio sp.]MCR5177024.1 coproporphyrinogen dehydrogenase HemZ [Anaerovibrio sp.]